MGVKMSGFGTLMIIFASILLIVGLYMYTGHKLSIFDCRPAFKNLTVEGWKNIGKYVILISVFVYILGIVGIIFNFE